ncbi:TetR/AcrR family transcriptional regulator [Cellulomonas sp. URHE0023]|uniref:TetR/AcrR family transcriptional regulator n=1 Tax=Cellulomonas sp. URHE0023 TaxID=1380354 RepID=UPI00068CC77B|nr:TetR/AcrR family transcriptional regulator [Cellulomonas sp. URHE0023]
MTTTAATDTAPPGDTGPGRSRGGYAKGRATRLELLDSAMQLFGEVGYHTASLREISARVGISHPGLLHHFPSKAALLEAVLVRRDEIDGAAFQADLDAGVDFFDAIVQVAERNAARPGIVELFATLSAEATSPDHPAHRYFQDRYRTTVSDALTAFEGWRVQGRLREGVEPDIAARLLVAVMDGLQVQFLMDSDTPQTRVDMASALRQQIAAFAAPPAPSR